MSRQQYWQWGRLKDGLCSQCGKHRLKSRTRCEVCLAKLRSNINAQRAKARSFRKDKSKKSELAELSVV